VTSFAYDAAGQRIGVLDASGHAPTTAYDLRGKKTATQ